MEVSRTIHNDTDDAMYKIGARKERENQIRIGEADKKCENKWAIRDRGRTTKSEDDNNQKITIGVGRLADLLFTPPVFWTKCEKFKFGQKTKITEGDELGFFAEKFGLDLPVILRIVRM